MHFSFFLTPTRFTGKALGTKTRNELVTHCKHRKECKCSSTEVLRFKPVWTQWKYIYKYYKLLFQKAFGQQTNGHFIWIELSNHTKKKKPTKTLIFLVSLDSAAYKTTTLPQSHYYHARQTTVGYFQVKKIPKWLCYNSFNTCTNMFTNDWT